MMVGHHPNNGIGRFWDTLQTQAASDPADSTSPSYGPPYLLHNAQSNAVHRVGVLALSGVLLFTCQGAPLTDPGRDWCPVCVLFFPPYNYIIAAVPKKINPFFATF